MSKEAADFVAKLSENPEDRERFRQDPDTVMNEHGNLSDSDKEVLKTQDPDKIKSYLGSDGPPGCLVLV